LGLSVVTTNVAKVAKDQLFKDDHTKDYAIPQKNFIFGLKFDIEINNDELLKNIGEHKKKKY
jgi:hypothetical protein